MPTIEKISEYLTHMPEPYQDEVLNYVEYLWSKLRDSSREQDDLSWQELSLASALRDMDESNEVTYSLDDLKEKF